MSFNMVVKSFVSEDRRTVTVLMEESGVALGHVIWEAPELEQFIGQLAEARARLADEVAAELDPGSRLVAIIDPAWRVPAPHESGKVLCLRHPGLGWLGFLLPWLEAKKLALFLSSDDPPTQE